MYLSIKEEYEMASYKGDSLSNKTTEILQTSRLRIKYKFKN